LLSLPAIAPGKTQQQTATAGLLMTVEAQGLQGFGYRPIVFRFTALTPLPADRSLTVEFATFYQWGINQAVRVTGQVEIPANATSATLTLRVPQTVAWDTFGVKVWEDGQAVEELTLENSGFGNHFFSEASSRVLVVGSHPTDLSGLLGSIATLQQAAGQNISGNATPTTSLVEAQHLYDQWLDYTTFDVVVAPWDELADVIENNQAAWQALRRWVSAGGNLVVFYRGDDWAWLTSFEALAQPPADVDWTEMSLPAFDTKDAADTAPPPPAAATQLQRLGVSYAPPPVPGWRPAVARAELEAWKLQPPRAKPAGDAATPLPQLARLVRSWDLGQVLVSREDLLSPDSRPWEAIWPELEETRAAAAPRLGVSAISPNPDFWNLLVPNVGLPPVDAFRVLITLFVLLIGPVNYFVLRRMGRLHLLVFIVPAAALLVTASLLAYAVLADGLGVKIRARTLTILDQPRSEGVCWSRLSYYAGLAPSGGLSFTNDTAIYPMLPASNSLGRGQPTRVVVWGEHQNLTRGWLASRTPTQLVTLRPTPTQAELVVQADQGRLELENRLGVEVLQVIVEDEAGQFFHSAAVGVGKTGLAEKTDPVDALAKLSPLLSAARPEPPPDMSGFQASLSRMYSFSGFDLGWSDPRQETSRLEQAFEALSRTGRLRRLPLGPRSYAALVRRSPLAEYGYEPVEEAGELHLILGRW
jgi:hypothetical protein